MSQPIVFPVGAATWSWIREGGRPERGSFVVPWLYGWQSFWFERHLAMQKALDQTSGPPPVPPVFILGPWRSGSTFLHDLLSACPGMIYPATWQCMSPASFPLRSPPAPGRAVVRPMDNFTIEALSPQEDEFALLALGVPSVYRGFFDPRRLPELARWLEPDAWSRAEPAGWLDSWMQFLAGIARGKSGRLVLKSPGHTFRIQALAEAFPQAAFVWLARDPVEVFLSNLKMWAAMFTQYALWPWSELVLESFLAMALEQTARCLHRATTRLSREQLIVVRFDRLTKEPVPTLESVNHRLRLGDWLEMRTVVGGVAAAKAAYQANVHARRSLPENVRHAVAVLESAQQAALASHGA